MSIFKRVAEGEEYFWITGYGDVVSATESDCLVDRLRYEAGNYCTDRNEMEHRAAIEKLNRNLWRHSCEKLGVAGFMISGQPCVTGLNVDSGGFGIIKLDNVRTITDVEFHDEEAACSAIEEVIIPWYNENKWFRERCYMIAPPSKVVN